MVEQLSPTGPAEVALESAGLRAPATAPFVRDRLTWLLYLLFGFVGSIINGLGPSAEGLRGEIGLSHAEANLHSSLMAAGTLVLGLVGERIIHVVGVRRTLWASVLVIDAGVLVFVTGRSLPITLAGVLLAGIGASLFMILVPSILSDLHGSNRSAVFSEINSIASGMGAVAPILIGASIAIGLTWRPGFAFGAALLLPALLLFARSVELPEHVGGGTGGAGRLPALFWVYWLAMVMFVSVEFCMLFGTTAFLRDRFGLDPAVAAGSLTVFLIGMVSGRALAGRIVLRRTPERLLVYALAVTASGFAIFWLAPVAPISLGGALLTGLGVAALYPMTLGLAVGVVPEAASLATARCTIASGIAVLLAPLVLGLIADLAGLPTAFAIVPVFGACGGAALLAARRLLSPPALPAPAP